MDKAPEAKKQKVAFRPTITSTPVPEKDAKKPIMPSSTAEFQKAKTEEDEQRK